MYFKPSDIPLAENDSEIQEESFKDIVKNTLRGNFRSLFYILICILSFSLIQFLFPFLSQAIIDLGIGNGNVKFIYTILVAQFFLMIGKSFFEMSRSWITLFLSNKINLTMISEFILKIMKLPIQTYENKQPGDILQRLQDHHIVENFISRTLVDFVFAIFSVFVYAIFLIIYAPMVTVVFISLTVVYVIWTMSFLKKRKRLNLDRFQLAKSENSKLLEIIYGMKEIKFNNAETIKKSEWDDIQVDFFSLKRREVILEQIQKFGTTIINELRNIVIILISATLVLQGEITLGVMMSILFLIGQLNLPVEQIIKSIYMYQDAKISISRIWEIRNQENEQNGEMYLPKEDFCHDISLINVSYSYNGVSSYALRNIDATIPKSKTTAIVGASGSGKTTFGRIILKYFEEYTGDVFFGNVNIKNINNLSLRSNIAIVSQEGVLFNDTLLHNVTIEKEDIDFSRFQNAIDIANLTDFVEWLPKKHETIIGENGVGLSGGQKQRILIARAIYKNSPVIIFDEATSALDANNEKDITENIDKTFKDRTLIIIAHRLSTIKNAHQILVMDEGQIVDRGSHAELIERKGIYYKLVINQLYNENVQ